MQLHRVAQVDDLVIYIKPHPYGHIHTGHFPTPPVVEDKAAAKAQRHFLPRTSRTCRTACASRHAELEKGKSEELAG